MQTNNDEKKRLSNLLILAAAAVVLFLIAILIAGFADDITQRASLDNDNSSDIHLTHTPQISNTPIPTIDPAEFFTPVPTAAPTPTMVPLKLDSVYRVGDEAYELLIMQNMLTDIGFDPGYADGKFGSKMQIAVEHFQLYAGLDDDGVVGAGTINELISSWQDVFNKPLKSELPLYGIKIGIDAGHQLSNNSNKEPIAPNSTETKARVSSGTQGAYTDVYEYVINLQVALRLKVELESLGADVVMTRMSHAVDISNAERAQMMNESKVDCWIRIHANGSSDEDKQGMFMLIPAEGSMDADTSNEYEASKYLAQLILDECLKTTDAVNLGVIERVDITGFNWSQVPVCLIEMGHMTNEDEDYLLVTKDYQEKIIDGIIGGFIQYFTDETY